MTYTLIVVAVIILSSAYFYYSPKPKTTKNIFNAEYYRGLNYLLNNEEDKAFKIFAALMDVDSSTIETHLALGGLYRKRGEFDKAILIHQNLLSRPTLEIELKNQALYELAKDFHSAGVYDRSEKIFKNLSEIKSYRQSCLEHLLKIYEVTKDWEKAIELVKSMDSILVNNQKTLSLLAQYYCEISDIYNKQNQIEKAIAISKKALKTNSECIRANYQLAKYYSRNDIGISVQYYYSIILQNKNFGKYIIGKIISLAKEIRNSGMILKTLTAASKIKDMTFIPDIYFFILYEKDKETAMNYINSFDRGDLVNNFIITHTLASTEDKTNVDSVVHELVNSYKNIFSSHYYFICNNCGYKSSKLNWICPSCNTWETIIPKSEIDTIEDGRNSE
jgi:lipopolysaccharide biosynthesis regulator YciM